MIKKFVRKISTTQSKFRANIERKYITQQCSYNLPNDVEACLKSLDALNRLTPSGNETNVLYELKNGYKTILGNNILAVIGNSYNAIGNKVIFTHTEGATGGTQKIQLKRTDFLGRGDEYNWFVDLYDKNIEGINFITIVDDEEKTVSFDLELTNDIFEDRSDDQPDLFTENDLDTCPRLKTGTNVILYGVPGAGKSWTIKHEYCDDESRMERLVFHPDYTYSDFVGQILPRVSDDGTITYEFTPGPFTKLVKKAYFNPDKEYYLVIEEVNRGNAPAIFGDVFQLLDRDGREKIENNSGVLVDNPRYRWSEYEITNNDIARVIYENENHMVSIPSNMSILCTMNTSDQNVFTLDTAFQRRWSMRLIRNKFSDDESEKSFAKTKILDTSVSWETFFREINKIILSKNIRMTSSEDKRLGTHFVEPQDLKFISGDIKQNSKFPEKVLKYLWDDAFKFTKEDVFDLNKVKSLEDVIDIFVAATGDDRFKVFKDNIYRAIVEEDSNS